MLFSQHPGKGRSQGFVTPFLQICKLRLREIVKDDSIDQCLNWNWGPSLLRAFCTRLSLLGSKSRRLHVGIWLGANQIMRCWLRIWHTLSVQYTLAFINITGWWLLVWSFLPIPGGTRIKWRNIWAFWGLSELMLFSSSVMIISYIPVESKNLGTGTMKW